jgi:hypothetical protein
MSVALSQSLMDVIHRISPKRSPLFLGARRRLKKQFSRGMRARRRRVAKPLAALIVTTRRHKWVIGV